MERTTRMLALWGALAWGILGTVVWASNGVDAVISDAEPSLDALLFALALTMTGVTIGITFGVVAGLIRRGRHPDNTTAEGQLSWMLPMGVGLLGLVTTPLFDGSPLSTMDWVLLAAGAHGKRSCLYHSHVMIHQPMGGAQGQVSDIEISYKLIKKMQKSLYEILAHHTGQPYENIERDCDRDNGMSSEDAKAYGLIDEVLDRNNPRARKQ